MGKYTLYNTFKGYYDHVIESLDNGIFIAMCLIR